MRSLSICLRSSCPFRQTTPCGLTSSALRRHRARGGCPHAGAVVSALTATRQAVRGHSTGATPLDFCGEQDVREDCFGNSVTTSRVDAAAREDNVGGGDVSGRDISSHSLPPPGFKKTRWTVRLHNMPRTWLHEEVIQFIHQVAEHAGIEPPSSNGPHKNKKGSEEKEGHDSDERGDEEADEEADLTSAVPRVTSPFVSRIHIPFGRRTGIVYGTPIIEVTSAALAQYLLHKITFDPDDYRNRIHFTEVASETSNTEEKWTNKDEAEIVQMEQQEALETLELDRYLFAPDLLYDIARMRQKRLVTRQSKLLLHTFADEEKLADGDGGDGDGRAVEGTRDGELRRVGDYKALGRGSMQNMPLAVPYVQGRRGT